MRPAWRSLLSACITLNAPRIKSKFQEVERIVSHPLKFAEGGAASVGLMRLRREATGWKGIIMSGNLLRSSAGMAFFAIPSMVIWSYLAFGLALAIGLVTIFLRGDWQKARGLDKLILFGPLFYAAPLAAFGTEHFTLTKAVASIVPRWIPWHLFWAYS